jgi:hypothetical protein
MEQTEVTAGRIIAAALERMRSRGWGKGRAAGAAHSQLSKRHCVGTALLAAINGQTCWADEEVRAAAFRHVKAVIEEQYPGQCLSYDGPAAEVSIPVWNDQPERTFIEVEAVMEKAALRAAEAGE